MDWTCFVPTVIGSNRSRTSMKIITVKAMGSNFEITGLKQDDATIKQNGSSFRAQGESRTSTDQLNDVDSQNKGSAKDSTVQDNQLNYDASIHISKYRIHQHRLYQIPEVMSY